MWSDMWEERAQRKYQRCFCGFQMWWLEVWLTETDEQRSRSRVGWMSLIFDVWVWSAFISPEIWTSWKYGPGHVDLEDRRIKLMVQVTRIPRWLRGKSEWYYKTVTDRNWRTSTSNYSCRHQERLPVTEWEGRMHAASHGDKRKCQSSRKAQNTSTPRS